MLRKGLGRITMINLDHIYPKHNYPGKLPHCLLPKQKFHTDWQGSDLIEAWSVSTAMTLSLDGGLLRRLKCSRAKLKPHVSTWTPGERTTGTLRVENSGNAGHRRRSGE